jgi:hypothetical protein
MRGRRRGWCAGGRGHNDDALGSAIHHVGEVELLIDLASFFDVEARDELARRSGLIGDELAPEKAVGRVPYLVVIAAYLDAAGLAAGARVDLGFYYPTVAADFARAIGRLLGAVGETAARYRHAKFREQLLGLVFVDVHRHLPVPARSVGQPPKPRPSPNGSSAAYLSDGRTLTQPAGART